jgi:hypothetical protein
VVKKERIKVERWKNRIEGAGKNQEAYVGSALDSHRYPEAWY